MNYVNHDIVHIFVPSNTSIFLSYFFTFFFFIYTKVPKDSSAKYYQDNKERLQIKIGKDIKIFLNKKKNKNNNMAIKDAKISQKMKNKS